jgi:hypothetical protein
LTVTNALEATHSRKWSSMMLRTSKTTPSATSKLLGRLCGWGVTKPRAFPTLQMVDTDGTAE